MKKIGLVLLVFCVKISLSTPLVGEDDAVSKALDYIQVSRINDNQDMDILSNRLMEIYRKPIEVNNAKQSELLDCPLFTSRNVFILHQYLQRHGSVHSKYELKYIPGFDERFIQIILPFISFKSQVRSGPRKAAYTLFYTPQLKADSVNLKYGDAFYLRTSISNMVPNLDARIDFKKDREELFYSKGQGISYFNPALSYENKETFMSKILLGNFRSTLASGLLLNTLGGGTEFSAKYGNMAMPESKIRIHSGSSRFHFMSGAAVIMKYKKVKLLLLASRRKFIGKIDSLDQINSESKYYVRSLDKTNNKTNEQNPATFQRIKVNELAGQISIPLFRSNVDFSYQCYVSQFSQPYLFSTNSVSPSNLGLNHSLALSRKLPPFSYSLEFAVNEHFKTGLISFLKWQQENVTTLAVLKRVNRGYGSFRENAFGVNDGGHKEFGCFLRTVLNLKDYWKMDGSLDLEKHPESSHNFIGAKQTRKWKLISLLSSSKLKFQKSLAIRVEQKAQRNILTNSSNDNELKTQMLVQKVRLNYLPNRSFQFQVEYASSGVNLRSMKGRAVQLSLRKQGKSVTRIGVVLYKVPDWDHRLYFYNQGMPFTQLVEALNGEGVKMVLNHSFTISEKLSLRVRVQHLISRRENQEYKTLTNPVSLRIFGKI